MGLHGGAARVSPPLKKQRGTRRERERVRERERENPRGF
ncbi:unnamed protein product [Spirodela intermedia]|uniref:Uncharacterized protein n=1 Tax=Spirodela intermedia TaxID=51605 RepID=A0A7I8KJ88_SPIIN|nr:unnamed protein product [Spirodela intermedia]